MTRKATAKVGRALLVCFLGTSGCASYEPLDLNSYDTAYDQTTIAHYYRVQAIAMREKANAQTTAAARYEALFGPEADIVFGAQLLARYYEQTAQEFERVAEAHASADRTKQRPRAAP